MTDNDIIAAVNTPGAHYIDGDGEEWVVGAGGADVPASELCCDPASPDFRDCHECGHDFDTPCCCINTGPATLGPCGCTDYHMADCPTLMWAPDDGQFWFDDDYSPESWLDD